MAQTDIEIAVQELVGKQGRYTSFWDYYDGRQPLVYSSDKLREVFNSLRARFTENWCAVVVDSLLDRVELKTPQLKATTTQATVTGQDALEILWEQAGIVDEEYNTHEDIAVTGEAFIIAWKNADGQIEAFHNDARVCMAQYATENPRTMRFAAKWWQGDDSKWYLNLYYPDRIEHWWTVREYSDLETPEARGFSPWPELESEPNPYGKIPVFHFRSNLRTPRSQLANATELQDAVNKLLADMMIAAEFGAFPQRYVISQAGIKGLRNNPNAIWDLVAGESGMQATEAGQFDAAPLSNYLDAINKLSADIGIITRTPRYYFFAQGGDPSGEALIVMESPLAKKTERWQATLLPVWRDLASFLMTLAGQPTPSGDIAVTYEPAATRQPLTEGNVRKLAIDAGMPLRTYLRREENWTVQELAQLQLDKQAENALIPGAGGSAEAMMAEAVRELRGSLASMGGTPEPATRQRAMTQEELQNARNG